MPLIKVSRSAQITLPVEIRKPLNIAEGDYLEAVVHEGGILLKPVTVLGRTEAWDKLFAVLGTVEGQPAKSPATARKLEEEVAEIVKEVRKKKTDA